MGGIPGPESTQVNDPSSFREVYRLISELRNDLLNRVDRLETSWESRMNTHVIEHQREKDYRSSVIRWAVTTLLSGAGIAFTMWLGISDKI